MMDFGLALFLMISSVATMVFLSIVASNAHKKKMKELEIESLKLEKANLDAAVDAAVDKRIGDLVSRIEVLEAIVTDKNYDLTEKITRLK